MQIDPRVSKSMLDMQLLNNMSATTQTGTADAFSGLLEQVGQLETDDAVTQENSGDVTRDENGLLWLQLGPSRGTASPLAVYPASSNAATDGPTKATAYDSLINEASQKYGVPVALIKAVIDTESSFNPSVTSLAGAKGLMQLMDATAQGLGVSDPYDPAQNIDAGVRYLSYQIKRFNGQENMALAAYNAGPGRVQRLGVSSDEQLMSVLDKLPVETQRYISKIQNAREKYTI
ncbi:lytic transglycosylase domain-containing protein [Paenibacillus polymyxa]|uniref:lytic transglycosylase domain-containing protein n=1 Tax=Paenibacillus polymyxa TaxID=1406 RepID=UPI0025B6D3BF|nr:lytic transglycosylase domain-containing protein [Paenibacillus polymyxa]MDN4082789.1 lytic transglycosylase domain-containing protein [Paenibacillus polymyxa]MDN4107790.1 lytic transglycosylase domain-containing protein [Paenibacillus polymyxa]